MGRGVSAAAAVSPATGAASTERSGAAAADGATEAVITGCETATGWPSMAVRRMVGASRPMRGIGSRLGGGSSTGGPPLVAASGGGGGAAEAV